LWATFFFHAMTQGFWYPALTNIMKARGLEGWVPIAFAVVPVAAMVSPLFCGALADQRVAAERLFAWLSFVGAVLLAWAFWCLDHAWNTWWFIGLLAVYSVLTAPMWGLLAVVSLAHSSDPARTFPLVRVGGTIGWMAAGMIASYVMRADTSPTTGYAATVARVLGGVCALYLPHTPPSGRAGSWRSTLGLEAFRLLKERDHLVFFGVTTLVSIPLVAFYMYVPEHLAALGDKYPTATTSLGQWSEVVGMLTVGALMGRWKLRGVLTVSLLLFILRFGAFMAAGAWNVRGWLVFGIVLHGICYTSYFITSQVFLDRRVPVEMRGQAQGLLSLVASGIGPLAGALVCGRLHAVTVEAGAGWFRFWGVLTGFMVLSFLVFVVFYRNAEDSESSGGAGASGNGGDGLENGS
jgi:nucleoside transporter